MPIVRRRTLAFAALITGSLALGASPAAADCVRATATYTSPSGSSTTVGSSCLVSTPYNETFGYTDSAGTTRVGTVTVSFGVPLP